MINWIKRKLDLLDKEIIKKEDYKCLINVFDESVKEYIYKEYGIKVPLGYVFCTKGKYFNSPLYFEMWEPSKEYIIC